MSGLQPQTPDNVTPSVHLQAVFQLQLANNSLTMYYVCCFHQKSTRIRKRDTLSPFLDYVLISTCKTTYTSLQRLLLWHSATNTRQHGTLIKAFPSRTMTPDVSVNTKNKVWVLKGCVGYFVRDFRRISSFLIKLPWSANLLRNNFGNLHKSCIVSH